MRRLAPTLLALLAACGTPPTPGPTPSPGPSAPPAPACGPRFEAFDADGDGRWRAAEVGRWMWSHPVVPPAGPCPRPGDARDGGRAVAQVGTGTAEPRCAIPAEPGAFLERLDRDGDGGLGVAEACAAVGEQLACEARFAATDADHDGKVVLAELAAATPAPPSGAAIGANPPPPDVTFRALDADADGALSPAELCAFRVARFDVPTAGDLTGAWTFGGGDEPPAGPAFGECPPGNGLRLVQEGERVTGDELVCGGPCYVPIALAGTYRAGRLVLVGVVPPPADDAGRRIAYDLRFDAATGHLAGTRDGAPFWAAPFVAVETEHALCPL